MQATAHFVFWTILFQTLIGFSLAYLIDRKFRGHAFWTTIILIPMMLSPAVVGNFWKFLYQPQIGLFNYVVSFFTGIPPSSFEMLGSVTLAPWAIVIVDTWMWTPYVMLICLAGLRSIPDYIYEAAEVDRASQWRQFWSITLPMALPFIMLAVLFRGIENFKMFDMVMLLTGGGPGSTTELASITLEAPGLRGLPHRLFLGLRHHPVRRRLRPRQHLREGPEQGEAAMSGAISTAHSVVEPSGHVEARRRRSWSSSTPSSPWCRWPGSSPPAGRRRRIRSPIRPRSCSIPSLEGYCNLFTTRTRQTDEYIAALRPAAGRVRRGHAQARNGDRRPVELRAALHQLADHRLRLDLPGGVARHVRGLRLLALQDSAEGRSAVLHPVDAHDAADRGRDPDLPDVPRARPVGHARSA